MRSSPDPRNILTGLRRAPQRMNGLIRRFARNRTGAVAMMFALSLIPLLGFIGCAVDYANAYRTQSKLQAALDSAMLAAGREVDSGATEERAKEVATQVLTANLGEGFPEYDLAFTVGEEGRTISAIAETSVDTYLMSLLGHYTMPVDVRGTVTLSGGKFEVVMVLDNSGSMAGSRIRDLREAAKTLTRTLFEASTQEDEVKIGLVPFAAAVNVGQDNANAPWMDTSGVSKIHYENFDDEDHTRFELFDQMRDTEWRGCVEVRPSPYDVTDSPAASGDGDSFFVPMFAPDEPDDGWSYSNDYLDDDDGSCSRRGRRDNESEEEAQEKTCKYDNERPSGWSGGPNYMCDPSPIMPLTTNEDSVIDAINDMEAQGNTNIMEGVMWGWRVHSPHAPFTEGRAYDDPENRKFMIVMTDGANTHNGTWTQNMSYYSAFGYAKNDRLRPATNSSNQLVNAMNGKTLQACNNAKAEGIFVYTIAFNIHDSETRALLRQCASDSSRAFTIENGDALISVFEAIATEINLLRISS